MACQDLLRNYVSNTILEGWNHLKKADVLGRKVFELFPEYEQTDEEQAMFEVLQGKQVKQELNLKNEELQRINNDLDNFVYTASHDLRTPIANLEDITNLFSRKIADRLKAGEQELLTHALQSVIKLKKTIAALTDIARVQKDLDAQAEELSFRQLFEEVYEGMASVAHEVQAQIKTNFHVNQVLLARKNLKSIIYNLLSNAIKYRSTEHPLEILVQTYRENDYIVLSVSDNGLEIPTKQQDKLFKMFKCLHTHVEGTEIGLYIIKRVVENRSGKISVESEAGQGATFKIYFKSNN